MDLADDIAYAVHDFEDGLELKIFEHECLEKFIKKISKVKNFVECINKRNIKLKIKPLIENKPMRKRFLSCVIYFIISNCQIKITNRNFKSEHLKYNIKLNSDGKRILKCLKDITWKYIIETPATQQLVKKGQIIVCHLFDVFDKNHDLLPRNTQDKFKNKSVSSQRVICDYISGMTDRYALKMFDKIFGSEYISFFEK
jgi:dGTPase